LRDALGCLWTRDHLVARVLPRPQQKKLPRGQIERPIASLDGLPCSQGAVAESARGGLRQSGRLAGGADVAWHWAIHAACQADRGDHTLPTL